MALWALLAAAHEGGVTARSLRWMWSGSHILRRPRQSLRTLCRALPA